MLLLLVVFSVPAVQADGGLVTTPPPQTGAYLAEFVEDKEHVSVINFAGNYDASLPDGSLNAEARAVVAQEFYRTHADEYDFLVVFSGFEFDTGEALAFHLGLKNEVSGIGLPLYDNSDSFGSDGKLQGYIDMAAMSRYVTDPLNPKFETVLSTLSHEILHQWGSYVKFQNADGSLNEGLLGKDDAHWSYLLDSNASVQYGARWQDNGDGTFTSTAVRKFFSPLDLYLMGVYSAAEVPPFKLIENPEIDKTQLPRENVTISGVAREVSIDEIIAAEGERLPAAADAQTEFRIGFVLLKGAEQQLPNHYFVALNNIRQAFPQRFAIVTGGRALAHVYPQAVPMYTTGTPGEIGAADQRPEADLDDGLAWLRSQQQPQGYWNDKDSTRLRDTTYALRTLMNFDPGFNGSVEAIEWINNHVATNTDYLARQIVMFGDNPALATVERLLVLQNADGGWGLAEDYDSDALDTALALLALQKISASPALMDKALQFLLTSQNTDGGWGNVPGGESRSSITATVLKAIRPDANTAAHEAALALLESRQNSDGGFGDSPSTVYDTANLLQIFMDFDRLDQIQAEPAAAFLFSRQAVNGSWDGSSYATALAISTLKRFNFSNWRLNPELSVGPVDPNDGERVLLSITVSNDSNLFTAEGTLYFYDGNPASGGVQVGEAIAIPLMAPGAVLVLSAYWDSLDQSGEHELYVVADPEGLFTELSESDNISSTTVTVLPAPDGIDLSVVESDIALLPAQVNRLPTTLGIVANIRNFGLTDATQVRVILSKTRASGATSIVDEVLLDVPNRSSVAVNFSDVLSEAGLTRYSVVIDPDNLLGEASDSNNDASVDVQTAASVDLAITSADISSDKVPAIVGEDLTFRVNIHNHGTLDTPTTQVRYVVANGTDSRELASNSLQLGPGESIEQSITWQVDLTGTLLFTAEIDFDALVTELDETNNLATYSVTANTRDGPNLIVSHIDLSFNPAIANEGAPVAISATVRNNGNVEAANVEVAFYDGDPSSGGVQIGELQSIASLASGAESTLVGSWDAIPSAGDKLIYVMVDPNDSVLEFSNDDNSAFNILTVLSLPDLAISSDNILIDPSFPSAGSEITLSARVANLGEQEASNILLRVFGSETGNAGVLIGEKTITRLAGGATQTLQFNLTLSNQNGSHSFLVQVDPDNGILERDRSNNSASRDIAVQDGDIFANNLYISPNGDGIQDATEVSFRLATPGNVTLRVVSEYDVIVRELETLENVELGNFNWDGLDDKGRLVADGSYRLRLVGDGETQLAEVLIQLDTNRSSLLKALNTEYQFFNNLTCELPNIYEMNVLENEARAIIEAGDSEHYPNAIYGMNINGSDVEAIIPNSWFGLGEPYFTQTSSDGSVIVFERYDPSAASFSRYTLWASDGDGENLRQILSFSEYGWVMTADGKQVLMVDGDEDIVFAIDVATGIPKEIYETNGYYIDRFSLKPQPNGDKLLFIDETYEDSGPALLLVDLVTTELVELGYEWRNDFEEFYAYAWSVDGSKIIVAAPYEEKIWIFDSNGKRLASFDLPTGFNFSAFGTPVWSSNGAEAALSIFGSASDGGLGNAGGIYVINLDDLSMQLVAEHASDDVGEEPASYHISTWDGSDWVERGELHYQRFYRDKQLDLSQFLPDADGEYKVRIRQTGMEAAHVESVALLTGKRRSIPVSAIKLENSRLNNLLSYFSNSARGEDVLASVRHNDFEVLDLFESEMQVEWIGVPERDRIILSLNAREEALSKLDTSPFTYSKPDHSGYDYRLVGDSPILVDGELTTGDGFDQPLFRHFSRPGTGHPSATVYGYIGSDDRYLYGALDFSVDNTMDGDLDWASMRVKTAQGWKEFRVTEQDSQYGMVNFTKTAAVTFTHKYYEFRIPLDEIAKSSGDSVEVSFQGYGTAAIVNGAETGLPTGGRLLWPPGNRALVYDGYAQGKWSIDLNLKQIEPIFIDWPGGSADIGQPYFLPSGRKMLFDSNRATNDPASVCYQQQTDVWSFESLLNLVVDLRAVRSSGTGTILLRGTASDLNFAAYTLEYASLETPDLWSPIFVNAATEVIDGDFTAWVPPAIGKYLVRLTAFDLAGNTRTAVKRVSWGVQSSISDLYLTPDLISPNADGVLDSTSLHYRVLEPVHLDFNVFNEQGDILRSFSRDHSLIGTEHDLVWDGRDSAGLAVADGRYKIVVQDFEFFVTVDNSAPLLSLLLQNARQTRDSGRDTYVDAEPRIDWTIVEQNHYQIELEYGEGPTPQKWLPLVQPPAGDSIPETVDIDEGDLALSIAQFTNYSFRIRVTDSAGNTSTLAVSPGAEELILMGKVSYKYEQLSPEFYSIKETLVVPIAQAFVEYRSSGGSSPWQEQLIENVEGFSEQFSFIWLPPTADFDQEFEMRIKAIDVAAQTYYSNSVSISYKGLLLKGLNRFTSNIAQSDAHNGLDVEGEFGLFSKFAENKVIIIDQLRITLQSSTDPRYSSEYELLSIDKAFELRLGSPWTFDYQTINLAGCNSYKTTAYLNYHIIDTSSENSGIRYYSALLQSEDEEGEAGEVDLPCLKINSKVSYEESQSCGVQPNNEVHLQIQPISENEIGLKLLTLYTLDAAGNKDIFYNVNKPQSGYFYSYAVDATQFIEGPLLYHAELTNDVNQVWTESIPILVDRSPPAAAITYPAPGQFVCATPRMLENGDFVNVVEIDIDVDDPYPFPVDGSAIVEVDDKLNLVMQVAVENSSQRSALPLFEEQLLVATDHIKSGNISELLNVDGQYTLYLQATDIAGNRQCVEQSFNVDGRVDVDDLRVDLNLFSPNDDDRLDSIEFEFSVNEAVTFDARVYASEPVGAGRFQISGDAIRQLANQQQALAGSSLLVWDGRLDDNSVATDAAYIVVFDYQDGCGNRGVQQLTVTVDNTAPDASIEYPAEADPLTAIVEVLASIDDPHLKHYVLELGQGIDPQDWLVLAGGSRSLTSEVLALWNNTGLIGPYSLRLSAEDAAENTTVIRVNLTLQERSSLLGYLQANPALFSPNGDNRRESSSIRIGLDAEALLRIEVQDENGNVVHQLLASEAVAAGAFNLLWDGKDDSGALLSDGTYSLVVSALLVSNTGVKQSETITLVIDTTAPALNISQPQDFAKGGSSIVGSIDDVHLLEFDLSFTSNPDAPLWESIASGIRSQSRQTLAKFDDLPEGSYAIKLSARDEAEIVSEQIVAFSVDNTPPQVEILTPLADAFIGAEQQFVDIAISVSDENIEAFTLNIGAAPTPETWTELITGSEFPLVNPVTSLDLNNYVDGSYSLQLVAQDKAGNKATTLTLIHIDTTLPLAVITTPADGSYVTAAVSIIGNASDANLDSYQLSVAPGDLASATQWFDIGGGSLSMTDAELLDWVNLPPDGNHVLRLRVTDTAGNSSISRTAIIVDSTPPAAPTGFNGEVENRLRARLGWQANVETDLAGYRLYRDGNEIAALATTETTYIGEPLDNGLYRYTLRAVDQAGLLSDESELLELVVDSEPPVTRIHAPAAGAMVGGIVEIRGTANSADDFKEYRLYLGAGLAPSNWQLLRQSPVAIIADLLYELDTSSLSEAAVYSLKLEAEDINGNQSQAITQFTIDNQPPAAPTGLVTISNNTDVNLSWNPNSEQDLLGYIVFRNQRIANSTGIVIGDLKPFALTAANYSDLALADGLFKYTVAAIDLAGNLSESSLPSEILIDTRAPQATLDNPADAQRFETALFVSASSEDTDLAQIQFQYKPALDSVWIDLGTADSASPYATTLDPVALLLLRGEYNLRAVATDMGARIDPAPAAITVHYTDITRPQPVIGVNAQVTAGEVSLSWNAAAEPDIAGYHIDRIDENGTTLRLTDTPLTGTDYVDSGLVDGIYSYSVIALDDSDNASDGSALIEARVYTPLIELPYSPVDHAGPITLQGEGAALSTLVGTVTNDNTSIELPGVFTDSLGRFSIPALNLALGDNVFTLRLIDSQGNISKDASITVVYGLAPAQPTGLTASVSGFDVSLNWNSNLESDLLGYRLFRDDIPLLANIHPLIDSLEASASDNLAANVIDGNSDSYWPLVQSSNLDESIPWLVLNLAESTLISRIEIEWSDEDHRVLDYDLQAWSGSGWATIAEQRDATGRIQSHTVDNAYYSDQIRLQLLRANLFENQSLDPVRLAEVRIQSLDIVTDATHIDTTVDGNYSYRVSAISTLGFESIVSDAAAVSVGDVTAPVEVSLAAEVTDSDVSLSWTSSAAIDVNAYELFRGGVLIAELDINSLAYTDLNLANGRYDYVVYAIDNAGNRSMASNLAQAIVNIDLALAPELLSVTAIDTGAALDLLWQSVGNDYRYRILRSTTPGGPYAAVAESSATGWRDSDLSNGVSYFYIVVALDPLGNESPGSNELSGLPLDTIAPAVTLLYPGASGAPFIVNDNSLEIIGQSEAAVSLSLVRDGEAIEERISSTDTLLERISLSDGYWESYLSPNGRYLLKIINLAEIRILDLTNGSSQTHELDRRILSNNRINWAADSNSFVYVGRLTFSTFRQYVTRYTLGGTARDLTRFREGRFDEAKLSHDLQHVAIIVNPVESNHGLWLKPVGGSSNSKQFLRLNGVVQQGSLQWSADDKLLAYLVDDDASGNLQLEFVDIASGAITVVDTQANALSPPNWSADGNSLLYSRLENGSSNIWRYDLASGVNTALTFGDENQFTDPREFIRGASILFVSAQQDLLIHHVARNTSQVLHRFGEIRSLSLHRSDNGYFALVDQDTEEFIRIAPVGRVVFSPVLLNSGDNRFTAIARDEYDNIGDPSNQLTIAYDVSNRPDLFIDSSKIRINPGIPLPGVATRINLEIANTGLSAVANAEISLFAIDQAGFRQTILDAQRLDHLGADGIVNIAANWIADVAGSYRLFAMLDPGNRIAEVSEANNSASLQVLVVPTNDPQMSISTNKPFYSSNEGLIANLKLLNGGGLFGGYVDVRVEDSAGYSVADIVSRQRVEMDSGSEQNLQFFWNSDAVFASGYRVHAMLYAQDNSLVADEFADFNISEVIGIATSVTSDLVSYQGNANVTVTAKINYQAGNALFNGGQASIQILDANAVVVSETMSSLGDLLPGDSRSLTLTWNTQLSVPGDYAVQFDVTRDQALVSQAQAEFSIVRGLAELDGSLQLAIDNPAVGQDQGIAYRVTNVSNAALTALPVRVSVIDPAGQQILSSNLAHHDILPGKTATDNLLVATAEFSLRSYTVLLEAMVDTGAGSEWVTLSNADFAMQDRMAPVISILQPAVGSFSRGDADILLRANDSLSFVDRVELQVNGSAWQPALQSDASNGEYRVALPNLADGSHQIVARAYDSWDNQGQTETVNFNVDNSAALIEVSSVQQAGHYNNAVAPVVTVIEPNLAHSYMTLNGLPFESADEVMDDGTYNLQVYATDQAGNFTQTSLQFIVDQTLPLISISGVEDGVYYASNVTPLIQISDAYLATQTISLNGSSFVSATEIEAEGEYRLSVAGTDQAGNLALADYRFYIDKSPPLIAVSGIQHLQSYPLDVSAEIEVTDTSPVTTEATLNGFAYVSGTNISAEGDYQLLVNVLDAAGNSSSAAYNFAIDKTPPAITITNVTDYAYYNTEVAPIIEVSDANLLTTTATLNGEDYQSHTPVYAEGDYRLIVNAADSVGHEVSSEIFFSIDYTAPIVTIETPLHGDTLYTTNTDVVGYTEAYASVTLQRGQLSLSTEADHSGRFTFNGIVLDHGPNMLSFIAIDRALNKSQSLDLSLIVVLGDIGGDIVGEIHAPRAVLILSPEKYQHHEHHEHDKHHKYDGHEKHDKYCKKKSRKDAQSQKHSNKKYPHCVDHQSREMFGHENDPGLDVINTALQQSDQDYLLVHNEADFVEALRSQRFGSLVLMDLYKGFCGKYDQECEYQDFAAHKLKLAKDTLHEIRAMVAAGTGLIWIKTRPDNHKYWETLTGIRFKGSVPGADNVEILDSDTAAGDEVAYSGRAVRIELQNAEALALLQPDNLPAITARHYGNGRAVVMAINPAALADSASAVLLMKKLLVVSAPAISNLLIDGVADVDWLVSNIEPGTEIELSLRLDPGIEFIRAEGAVINNLSSEATWSRLFSGENARFKSSIQLPGETGIYEISANLSLINNNEYLLINDDSLQLDVGDEFANYSDELIVALSVPVESRKNQKVLDYVSKKLLEALQYDPYQSTPYELNKAMGKLIKIVDKLEKSNLDSEPLIRQVGELLKIYQLSWYQKKLVLDE